MHRIPPPGLGIRLFVLAIAMLLPVSTLPVAADTAPVPQAPMGDREITIVNKSKQSIKELYVAPANTGDPGDDRLGDETLEPGDNVRVRLGRMRECGFDVQVVYDDDSKEESRNINVCRTRQFAFDGSNAAAPPAKEQHAVMIVNASARPIQMVFISPARSNDWGEDLLADDSISVAESKSVTYRGDCTADLRIVFDNRSAEERKALNMCDTQRISIQPGWTTADTPPTGDAPDKVAPGSPAPPVTVTLLDVTVVNHSGHDAAELYLYPQDVADRGADRLGMNVLRNNAQINLRIPRGRQCRFHAHVVYEGKTPDGDLTGLDLCATPQVTLPPP